MEHFSEHERKDMFPMGTRVAVRNRYEGAWSGGSRSRRRPPTAIDSGANPTGLCCRQCSAQATYALAADVSARVGPAGLAQNRDRSAFRRGRNLVSPAREEFCANCTQAPSMTSNGVTIHTVRFGTILGSLGGAGRGRVQACRCRECRLRRGTGSESATRRCRCTAGTVRAESRYSCEALPRSPASQLAAGEHLAGLQQHVKDQDDESNEEAARYRAGELPRSEAGALSADVAPVAERQCTGPHDDVDRPLERDAGELGDGKYRERGYGEKKESRFCARSWRALPSEVCVLPRLGVQGSPKRRAR
jgi:hypothetical protein